MNSTRLYYDNRFNSITRNEHLKWKHKVLRTLLRFTWIPFSLIPITKPSQLSSRSLKKFNTVSWTEARPAYWAFLCLKLRLMHLYEISCLMLIFLAIFWILVWLSKPIPISSAPIAAASNRCYKHLNQIRRVKLTTMTSAYLRMGEVKWV